MTDRRSGTEIAATLRERILSGRWQHGDRMPGTRDIATEFGTTPQTAATAYAALEAMGMVRVGRGAQGTVVTAGPVAEAHLGTFSLPDLTAAKPWKPAGEEDATSETTSFRQLVAGPYLAKCGIPEGTPVVERTRIRSVAGTPVQHKITVIPEGPAACRPAGYDGVPPMMAPVGVETVSPPAGMRIAEWLGWDVSHTDAWIEVEPMEAAAAEALGLAPETPGYQIVSAARASDGSVTCLTVTTLPLHHRITLTITEE